MHEPVRSVFRMAVVVVVPTVLPMVATAGFASSGEENDKHWLFL